MNALTCACHKLQAAGWRVRCAACGANTFPVAPIADPAGLVAVAPMVVAS